VFAREARRAGHRKAHNSPPRLALLMEIPTGSEILEFARGRRQLLQDFLTGLIRIPSIHGKEAEAQSLISAAFADLGLEVEEMPIPESLRTDREYTYPEDEIPYEGRPNLTISFGPGDPGKGLVINTHSDVVPAKGWSEAFDPVVADGELVGRGAVDCKGHIGALYLLALMLREHDVRLQRGLELQVVIEEEIGGNGSLSLIRQGHAGDAAIVLEGSDLTVCPANRGAIWFRATVEGKAVHMARKFDGVSALDHAMELIGLLYDYEGRLTEESRGQELFEEYEHPVQVNIGRLEAGDWPATVPAMAVLEGGVGFLPNRNLESIRMDLKELPSKGGPWLASHARIEFPRLHNDAYRIPPDHPLVVGLARSMGRLGREPRVRGMIARCDARLFNKVGGVPTVVFGSGSIDQAHSKGEKVRLEDLELEAGVLFDFVCRWCGEAVR
jgi:acetylornithine deacetylase